MTKLASAASSGATTITVVDNLNWEVGDVIAMPQLPVAEAPTVTTNPFIATVTSVSGNTLTLNTGLPHAYPAGAEVAKVNRSIVLRTATTSGVNLITAASGQTVRVTGLKWLSFLGTAAAHFIFPSEFYNLSVIEYVSYPPNYAVQPQLSSVVGNVPRVKYCFGNMFQFTYPHIAIHEGGVLGGHTFLAGGYTPPLVENARVWNAYIYSNLSQKVVFRNCVFTNFVARASTVYYFEDCIFYGYAALVMYGSPVTYITIARNCKFYPLSQLGYSTTYRPRFDWLYDGGVILADYINCEFYGTWVEPFSFVDWIGFNVPKVKFVNKRVGNTLVKEQEFQAGGVITADETMLPPGSNVEYTLKFAPKNPNMPIVYDILLQPKSKIAVYFRHDGSSSLLNALIAIVDITRQYVVDPLNVQQYINCLNYPANQWNSGIVENPDESTKILRLMVRGTAGQVWFYCIALTINLSGQISLDITEETSEVEIYD